MQIVFDEAEHPELSGMKEGDPIASIECKDAKVVSVSNGQVTVEMGTVEVETEGQADKALRQMRGTPSVDAVEGVTDDEIPD